MAGSPRERRRPAQDRSRALVDAVLDATAEVLREHGAEGATIARIADRAGVSVGSLYQYFPTKDALYTALGERFFARLDAAVEQVRPALSVLPLREAIALAIQGALGIALVDPELDRLLHRLAITGTSFGPAAAFEVRQEARIAAFLHERRAELPDPGLDVDLAARLIMRAIGGIVSSTLAREPALSLEPRFLEGIERLVGGYVGFPVPAGEGA